MKYREMGRVCETYLGTPVCLVLNVAAGCTACRILRVVVAITLRIQPESKSAVLLGLERTASGPSRTWLAEAILGRALDEGLLAPEYDDQERRHGGVENGCLFDSRDISVADRRHLFDEVTFPGDLDLNWGADPTFVVSEMADHSWRKIMIVDTLGKTCTFRSTTTDPAYPLKDNGRRNGRWFLDRSMQGRQRRIDASVPNSIAYPVKKRLTISYLRRPPAPA